RRVAHQPLSLLVAGIVRCAQSLEHRLAGLEVDDPAAGRLAVLVPAPAPQERAEPAHHDPVAVAGEAVQMPAVRLARGLPAPRDRTVGPHTLDLVLRGGHHQHVRIDGQDVVWSGNAVEPVVTAYAVAVVDHQLGRAPVAAPQTAIEQ